MTIKAVLRCALILSSASIGVMPAFGTCNPPKSVMTYNFSTGAFSYWHTSLSGPTLRLNADIWSGGGDHTGTCNVSPGILYFGATPGDFGINLSLGDACTPGCPSGSLTILASATDGTRAETLAAQALEAPGAVNFDFSATGSRALVEYPRPHATSVTRLGDQVFIGLFIPPVSVYDDAGSGITGFNILTATASSDPGRSPGAYTLNTHVPSPGGSGVTANVTGLCPSGGQDDVWLAVQITTSAGASSLVSQSFRIHCHILAEPTRRIDKRMGTQTDN